MAKLDQEGLDELFNDLMEEEYTPEELGKLMAEMRVNNEA